MKQRSCKEYRSLLQRYMDNELLRVERMEVEAHMESCPHCAGIYEQLCTLYGADKYVEIPESVVAKVVKRVQEQMDDDADAFASNGKIRQFQDRLEKNRALKTWMIVLSVFVFGIMSWFISVIADGGFSAGGPVGTPSHIQSATEDEYSAVLAQSIRDADAIIIQFGMNRIGISEQAYILKFADYIAYQPALEYEGVAVSESLGTIVMQPNFGYTITITSNHRLLVNDGQRIMELQTQRTELLEMLHILGL